MLKKIILPLLLLLLLPALLIAQSKRNLLAGTISSSQLAEWLRQDKSWIGFPAYEDRAGWEKIPAVYRSAWIKEGEKVLNYKWQIVPASSYLEFVRTGNRDTMQNVNSQNTGALRKLILAELAEGKGRFLPQIIDGSWSICEMTTWALSAHLSIQKAGYGLPDVKEPIIDLGVGITGALMAWTHHFFKNSFDKVSPLIASRIATEIDRQVLQPYYSRTDFWWMGLQREDAMVNNWNVWCNFNALTCILLIEKDKNKRIESIYKSMQSVDKFINYYKDDGGCEEGPAYWSHAGGMLFNYLDLLSKATGGAINKFNDPLIRNIAAYIYKAYINDRYYINYADASAKLNPDAGLIFRYGQAISDSIMTGFGSYLAAQQNWKEQLPTETIEATLENALAAPSILQTPARKPLLADWWMPGTQIMAARDQAGSTDGFYFSALGGHNAESHNHNDVGSCILFYNGQPVLIDIGSETYTRQTFGPERYSIWTMQSAWHNLPLINGVIQKEGAAYKAVNPVFTAAKKTAGFSLDIAAAYPTAAAVKKWERSYLLTRGQQLSITDNYELLENKGNTALHFMTSLPAELVKPGQIRFPLAAGALTLDYNPQQLEAVLEPVAVKDKRLLQSWPATVYRIVLKVKGVEKKGKIELKIKKA